MRLLSDFTTEVRYICEYYNTDNGPTHSWENESQDGSKVNDVIENSRRRIFRDFPIFDENYRAVLETKILKHYYFREIGCETVGQWKVMLDMRMNEIMPYYNQLYESAALKFDPLTDFNYNKEGSRDGSSNKTTQENRQFVGRIQGDRSDTRTIGGTDNETTKGSVENNETNNSTVTRNNTVDRESNGSTSENNQQWKYFHDTPQDQVNFVDNHYYLTNAEKTQQNNTGSHNEGGTDTENGTDKQTGGSDGTTTSSGSRDFTTARSDKNITAETTNTNDNETTNGKDDVTTTDKYIEHYYGKNNGTSYSKLLQEFRDTFLNIDMMIINDLEDLFMGIWNAAL